MKTQSGMVYLIGAGPGDPGLITVRGLALLKQAEVLVYDALANKDLVREAPDDAELIYVGKRSTAHTMTQDQINQVLVDKALEGKKVVRLKGGDPYLFGRGAEEAAYLAKHHIRCQIIAGITAGIAAPAAAGFAVTHRKIASSVTFVTGHEDPTKPASGLDYRTLAGLIQAGGTVCFYMGVGRLGSISRELQSHGCEASTPTAVVQWGTLPCQRHIKSTLEKACDDIEKAGISSPAIIAVGKVIGIDEPGLDWFTTRPLFGQTIVITRTRHQASDLLYRLAEQGAHVLEAPTISLVGPDSWDDIDQAIKQISDYQWLVLTSSNGVQALAERLTALGLDSRQLAGVKVAAIGRATADALEQQLNIHADFVPTKFVAESLAGELIAQQDIAGQRFLLLRADIARPALPKLLVQGGAHVTELTAYQTVIAASLPDDVLEALQAGKVDWITFTSSSTAQNMVQLLGEHQDLLKSVKIASIGPITTQTVRHLGFEPAIEAQQSDIHGLVDALIQSMATA